MSHCSEFKVQDHDDHFPFHGQRGTSQRGQEDDGESGSKRSQNGKQGLLGKMEVGRRGGGDPVITPGVLCILPCTSVHLAQAGLTAEPESSSWRELTPQGADRSLCNPRSLIFCSAPHRNLVNPEVISPRCQVPACALSDCEPLSESLTLHPVKMLFAYKGVQDAIHDAHPGSPTLLTALI